MARPDTVEISNLALGMLGAKPIISLQDDSTQADWCRRWYPLTRDAVLEDVPWTFATARTVLPQAATPPSSEFDYAYTIPHYILSVLDVSFHQQTFEPPAWWQVESGQIVVRSDYGSSENSSLYVKYIQFIEDTTKFPPQFANALVVRLAANLALSLTESGGHFERLWGLYTQAKEDASSSDGVQGRSRMVRSDAIVDVRRRNNAGLVPTYP